MQKTINITNAIAVMLSNCKGPANQIIFDIMCSKTMAYDEEPENGNLIPRTLLNQNMLHMMMTLDKYTRLLSKKIYQENAIIPN